MKTGPVHLDLLTLLLIACTGQERSSSTRSSHWVDQSRFGHRVRRDR